MTEDIQVTSGVPEYNRNVPSEKPPLQVIDIIDQMANSVEIFPYENAEFNPDSLLLQADQEGTEHLVESAACDVSGREKEYQGFCEENNPISTRAHEATKPEERNTQQLAEEKIYSTNEAEEDQEEQLHQHKERIETEMYLEVNETATADFDGAEEVMQNENYGESHKEWQETNSKECIPVDPRSNSEIEKPNEEPGAMKKSDISRHSYSRYNTISYRKIRKGNTKQRIDEFESMMHS